MNRWAVLLPELILAATVGLVLFLDLFLPAARKRWLSGLALLGALLSLSCLWLAPQGAFDVATTGDFLGGLFRALILSALALVLLSSWDFDRVWGRPLAEYLVLLLSAALGMLFLVQSQELILLYIGLELATFPLVLLTAFRPADPKSAEGGLKYLLLAALASSLFLFGLSLIYASTGATQMKEVANAISGHGFGPMLLLGLLCVLVGVGFKLALVPFHFWAPDAYEGAPTPVAAFLSVASKTAGFALAVRLLGNMLPGLRAEWGSILAILSVASMTWGNLAAFHQTDLKRLLAYSSIAQAGNILMGLVAFQSQGLSALVYYLMAYLFTNLAAFAVVIAVERTWGGTRIEDMAGLAQTSPRLALVLLLSFLSLAGIPPLAGFTAKFYLFTAVFGQGYTWLVVAAVVNSAISLYYYLRVIRVLYILPPAEKSPKIARLPVSLGLVLLITTAGILVVGVFPYYFIHFSMQAFRGF